MNARQFTIQTALAEGELLFVEMDGREELGRLFHYRLKLYSPSEELVVDEILGQKATVTMLLGEGEERYFNGYITQLNQVDRSQGGYAVYEAVINPWFWLLTLTCDCKIFQNISVPEIICEVFDDHGFGDYDLLTTQAYPALEYCVQYRESAFNFVSRLMEREGIYYYFTHHQDKHILVLADSISGHQKLQGESTLPYHLVGLEQALGIATVTNWYFSSNMKPTSYTHTDFDFIKPKNDLQMKRVIARNHAQSENKLYDYPGGYTETDLGGSYAQTRIEEQQVGFQCMKAQTDALNMSVGGKFKLIDHPRDDQNDEYLVTAANYRLKSNEYNSQNDVEEEEYRCDFNAITSDTAFRATSTTPKAIVQGSQTAIVVGPAGEDIYPDEYGRVKVQFHWDRLGKNDDNSSCWVRVQQIWAGPKWGAQFIPRIGHEVIVEFLEGDPDKPIITGRVYNDQNMPTYSLPDNKTQSGIKSQSTTGGSASNFNEIRLEDKKGSEELYFQAEKNQKILVKNSKTQNIGNNETTTIGNDQSLEVGNDQSAVIGNDQTESVGNNRTETVGADEKLSVGANRTRSVAVNESITVGASRSHTIKANEAINIAAAQNIVIGGLQGIEIGAKQSTKIGATQSINIGSSQSVEVGSDQTFKIGAGQTKQIAKDQSLSIGDNRTSSVGKDDSLNVGQNLVIEAGDAITIKCGKAEISMKKDGTVVIKGKDISFEASGKMNAKASKNIVMKGKKILQN